MDNNNMMNNGDNFQYDPNNQFNSMGSQQYDNSYNQYTYQPYQENIYKQPGEGGTDGKAIASLICGIFGILTCCGFGIPAILLGIIAIVMAILAKSDNMGKFPGMAIGGLVCGIIAILLGVAYIAFYAWIVYIGSL